MTESKTESLSPAIVITGASDGIGKAMAVEFARRGVRLGLIARRKELLESLAEKLRGLGAAEVLVEPVDVTDFDAQRSALDRIESRFGEITHLVLNAGIGDRSDPWSDSWAGVKECLDVNLMAALNATEWMKPRMVRRGSGTIAGVSSVAAYRGLPDSGAYSTSKAALTTYLESLRVDVARFGVRVVTVAPGYVRTELTKKNRGAMPFLMDVDRAGRVFARGVLGGKRVVVAPWPYRVAIVFLRSLPVWLYDFLIGKFVKGVRGDTPESRRASRT
jgi:short-subunit dehydrogenase